MTLLPALTLAQDFDLAGSNFKNVIDYARSIIDLLVPILSALAFLLFFWGLSKFILSSGNQKEIEAGKNYMIWGVAALFILLSFPAIVGLVTNELFNTTPVEIKLPT